MSLKVITKIPGHFTRIVEGPFRCILIVSKSDETNEVRMDKIYAVAASTGDIFYQWNSKFSQVWSIGCVDNFVVSLEFSTNDSKLALVVYSALDSSQKASTIHVQTPWLLQRSDEENVILTVCKRSHKQQLVLVFAGGLFSCFEATHSSPPILVSQFYPPECCSWIRPTSCLQGLTLWACGSLASWTSENLAIWRPKSAKFEVDVSENHPNESAPAVASSLWEVVLSDSDILELDSLTDPTSTSLDGRGFKSSLKSSFITEVPPYFRSEIVAHKEDFRPNLDATKMDTVDRAFPWQRRTKFGDRFVSVCNIGQTNNTLSQVLICSRLHASIADFSEGGRYRHCSSIEWGAPLSSVSSAPISSFTRSKNSHFILHAVTAAGLEIWSLSKAPKWMSSKKWSCVLLWRHALLVPTYFRLITSSVSVGEFVWINSFPSSEATTYDGYYKTQMSNQNKEECDSKVISRIVERAETCLSLSSGLVGIEGPRLVDLIEEFEMRSIAPRVDSILEQIYVTLSSDAFDWSCSNPCFFTRPAILSRLREIAGELAWLCFDLLQVQSKKLIIVDSHSFESSDTLLQRRQNITDFWNTLIFFLQWCLRSDISVLQTLNHLQKINIDFFQNEEYLPIGMAQLVALANVCYAARALIDMRSDNKSARILGRILDLVAKCCHEKGDENSFQIQLLKKFINEEEEEANEPTFIQYLHCSGDDGLHEQKIIETMMGYIISHMIAWAPEMIPFFVTCSRLPVESIRLPAIFDALDLPCLRFSDDLDVQNELTAALVVRCCLYPDITYDAEYALQKLHQLSNSAVLKLLLQHPSMVVQASRTNPWDPQTSFCHSKSETDWWRNAFMQILRVAEAIKSDEQSSFFSQGPLFLTLSSEKPEALILCLVELVIEKKHLSISQVLMLIGESCFSANMAFPLLLVQFLDELIRKKIDLNKEQHLSSFIRAVKNQLVNIYLGCVMSPPKIFSVLPSAPMPQWLQYFIEVVIDSSLSIETLHSIRSAINLTFAALSNGDSSDAIFYLQLNGLFESPSSFLEKFLLKLCNQDTTAKTKNVQVQCIFEAVIGLVLFPQISDEAIGHAVYLLFGIIDRVANDHNNALCRAVVIEYFTWASTRRQMNGHFLAVITELKTMKSLALQNKLAQSILDSSFSEVTQVFLN